MIDPTTLPPASLLLAYWFGGAFLMAAKRLAEYKEISVKGAVPAGGAMRTYQCWYRNAASFCTTATFNLTNGFAIQWVP